MSIKITGTGSYIPLLTKKNSDFLNTNFLNADGTAFKVSNEVIIKKFKSITGIEERRYAKDHHNTSDLAFFAAEKAIKDAEINQETIDYIIVAHNFGDIKHETKQSGNVGSGGDGRPRAEYAKAAPHAPEARQAAYALQNCLLCPSTACDWLIVE